MSKKILRLFATVSILLMMFSVEIEAQIQYGAKYGLGRVQVPIQWSQWSPGNLSTEGRTVFRIGGFIKGDLSEKLGFAVEAAYIWRSPLYYVPVEAYLQYFIPAGANSRVYPIAGINHNLFLITENDADIKRSIGFGFGFGFEYAATPTVRSGIEFRYTLGQLRGWHLILFTSS